MSGTIDGPARRRIPANLLQEMPQANGGEDFLTAIESGGVRIERIVSTSQASPDGFCYDQPQREWILILAGAAKLRFADESSARVLAAGDHIDISPRRRHRVEWTDPDRPTVWLAVHFPP